MAQKEIEYYRGLYGDDNVFNRLLSAVDPTANVNANDITPFGEGTSAQFEIMAGWTFAYKINPAQVESFEVNGGTVTQDGSFAKIETGTDPNGNAFIFTTNSVVYSPGIGNVIRFTAVFDTPQENSLQLIGLINQDDGWAFGYDGLKFGITRRVNGVDNWTYIEDWTGNVRDDFNPQLGNVYQISYQWLGFGDQSFAIENNRGLLENVHTITYGNSSTEVSVNNPNLPLSAGVANTGNTTNIRMLTPSAVGGSYGERYPTAFTTLLGYEYKETITQASDYLFSFFMPETYEGKDNRLYVEFLLFSAGISGNNSPVTFRALLGAELTGAVYTPLNSVISPVEVDTSATSYTGGQEVFSLTLSNDASDVVNLREALEDTRIYKGQILTLVTEKTAGGSVDAAISLTLRSRI